MDKRCVEKNCNNWERFPSVGLCDTHYSRRAGGYEEQTPTDDTAYPQCEVKTCHLQALSRTKGAYCREHFQADRNGVDVDSWQPIAGEVECWVETCRKRGITKGLCHYHYNRARQGKIEVPSALGLVPAPYCGFSLCKGRQKARGLCHGHNTQRLAGIELKELRVWGEYSKGDGVCEVSSCQGLVRSRGLCKKHLRGVTEYKMTPEEVIKLFRYPVCANPGCKNTTKLNIDHCHATGRIRGLLCMGCNTSLGFLGEDHNRIRGLIRYLDSSP